MQYVHRQLIRSAISLQVLVFQHSDNKTDRVATIKQMNEVVEKINHAIKDLAKS